MAAFVSPKLMEWAIEVMRQSKMEPRGDGKASPKVGAVLWKPDGSVGTAGRGQLRNGDHAEFTLLERKNLDCKLDDAVLFATLEPCALRGTNCSSPHQEILDFVGPQVLGGAADNRLFRAGEFPWVAAER